MLAAISESESLASSVATENVEHGERMEFLLAECAAVLGGALVSG